MADVEVVLAARIPADGSFPTLARTMTDQQGAFRLEVDRQRLMASGLIRFIWAYRPGRTVGHHAIELTGSGPLPPVRLTLDEPLKRTVTILDAEGRPVAGVRLAPVLLWDSAAVRPLLRLCATPDDRWERMTVVTGPDGLATLPYLPARLEPLTVRVAAPGIAPHKLPVPAHPGIDRFTLKLGRPARLAGSVSYDSGQPAANMCSRGLGREYVRVTVVSGPR